MVVGALVAIGIAKMPFGGLGHNPFNPAIVARVTLLIAFPVQMTSWPVPTPIWGFADAVTGPTTLGLIKEGGDLSQIPTYANMLLGQMGGSFGEVSAIALLILTSLPFFKRPDSENECNYRIMIIKQNIYLTYGKDYKFKNSRGTHC